MDGSEQIKDERDKEKFEFWEKVLQRAKYVVAPMVDQSELAWRMLSRRYGAQLCYTPMFHASVFIRDENYRKEALLSCPEDRPLIVQFCANDPNIFLKAALLAQDSCDAIDLNLGCPQSIAKREGNLHNPALFSGLQPNICEMSEQYFIMVNKYPCPLSYIRGHLFKLWHHALQVHIDLRTDLARAKNLESIKQVNDELKKRCQEDMKTSNGLLNGKLPLPYWICQPFVRTSPAESKKMKQEKSLKRPLASIGDQDRNYEGLSKNQIKKRMRNPSIKFDSNGQKKGKQYQKCVNCGNPKGLRCIFELCRSCCKNKAHKMMADCPGHHLYFKSKQEKRLKWEAEQKEKERLSQELECHVTELEIESITESDQSQDKEIQQTESTKLLSQDLPSQ
ncbi:tRNA-dihydrouridine(16/17) synthase [NAD(P)(+)]-like [Saccoglossus kowalevskii]